MSKKAEIIEIQTQLTTLVDTKLVPLLAKLEADFAELYALQETDAGRDKAREMLQHIQELVVVTDLALGIGSGAVYAAREARSQLHKLISALERLDASNPYVAAVLLSVHDLKRQVEQVS